MALVKVGNYYPNYHETFSDDDVKKFDVYSENNEKIGSVHDILVDENGGNFRYLIVDTGFWVFGKKVLLPVGLCRIDYDDRRVYALSMTKEQVENLPEFTDELKIDNDYEERVRGVYRPTTTTATAATTATTSGAIPQTNSYDYDRDNYDYDKEPYLYGMQDRNYQTLKLYEERLVAGKTRQKAGEVTVGKHVETQTTSVAVPVEKERVVIERTTPTSNRPVSANEADFREGEVARMEVYEETPDIRKETVVREEVNIRKESDIDTVTAQEKVRREELDVDAGGRPVVNKVDRPSDRA